MDIVPGWDTYFMEIAKAVSLRSKDPATKVGCIVVDQQNRIIGTGYNGMSIGMKETQELWERPTKYAHVIHAEVNALNYLTKTAQNATLYTTMFCCADCAKRVAREKLSRVVYLNDKYDNLTTREIFKCHNIVLEKLI